MDHPTYLSEGTEAFANGCFGYAHDEKPLTHNIEQLNRLKAWLRSGASQRLEIRGRDEPNQ